MGKKKHNVLKMIAILALTVSGLLSSGVSADQLNDAHKINQERTKSAQASQTRVDQLNEQRIELLDAYKETTKIIDGLRVYNSQLEKQINLQKQKLQELDGSIEQAIILKRQITPLMVNMLSALKQFVKLDVPFHERERSTRLNFISEAIDNPDISDSEKFRQVLEGFQIENEYGRKIDAYSDTIELQGNKVNVNILRVGRIALMAQTKDEQTTLAWDNQNKRWVELASSYRNPVRQGIRIARKQATRDVMLLPISAPKKANEEGQL